MCINIRYPNGREGTVIIGDLAPCPVPVDTALNEHPHTPSGREDEKHDATNNLQSAKTQPSIIRL